MLSIPKNRKPEDNISRSEFSFEYSSINEKWVNFEQFEGC